MNVALFGPAWTLLSGLVAAGCALAIVACGSSAGTGGTTASLAASSGLMFTHCMRVHGVTDFPDPLASGGFPRGSEINESAPVVQTARKACQGILRPNVAPPGPTAAAMAAGLTFAECMRAHRVPNFPDPVTRGQVPPNTDVLVQGGLMFPVGSSIDPGSPAFQRAASACGGAGPGGTPQGG